MQGVQMPASVKLVVLQVIWTLKLLADELISLEIVDEVSATTVGRVLKKMNLNHG